MRLINGEQWGLTLKSDLPSSMKYLVIEDFGTTFRHPYDKNMEVTVAISKQWSQTPFSTVYLSD